MCHMPGMMRTWYCVTFLRTPYDFFFSPLFSVSLLVILSFGSTRSARGFSHCAAGSSNRFSRQASVDNVELKTHGFFVGGD